MQLDGIPSIAYNLSMKSKRIDLASDIRAAMRRSKLSIYAVAKAAGLRVSIVQRFDAGGGLTTDSASALCNVLGLRLVDDGKGR
jgi:hypothetical protein